MYERITLKDKGSVPAFIQAIVERCGGPLNSDFFKRLYDGIVSASGLPTDVKLRNQCQYVAGESRWCSELLTDLGSFISGSARAHCHALGAEAMGFDKRDIRAIHAAAIKTMLHHLNYRVMVMSKTGRMSSTQSNAIYECYDQFQDYLANKVKTRDKVRVSTEGYILTPVQVPEPPPKIWVKAVKPDSDYLPAVAVQTDSPPEPVGIPAQPSPQEYRSAIIEAQADSLVRHIDHQAKMDALADEMIRVLNRPGGVKLSELHAVEAAMKFLKQRQLTVAYGGTQSPEALMQTLHNKGKDTMSLGINVSPFNFSKPAIEEIKFVYGISVKELTLDRVTVLLTDRQAEVDRLKALPHKPEVIKAKIATLKGEIKDILALANELFPVVTAAE